jgi:tetratricopeptide (TPR) repeat protein
VETAAVGRQISAGGDISGIASTGEQAVNIQNRAEQMTVLPPEAYMPVAEVHIPPGLTNLPKRPGLFVGRAAELARLDVALAGPGGIVVQALHGLGGVGKSTLAARWAADNAARHALTWWITADTPAGIDAELASLATALQPTLTDVLPAKALRERAVQWLACHQGWLVVLDNVSDPADIAPLLARASTGRYLITSRRATGWHNLAEPVQLDVLEEAEALDLLIQILGAAGPRDLHNATELCTELGFLPLAIEQAGAYLTQSGITLRNYLDLLEDYPAEMYRATAEGEDAERTIARVWQVTLDRLADEPLNAQVLRILAWYAPDAIPRALLDGLASPPALISAIGRLAAYSMIRASPGVVSVHRLVQAVARTPEPGDPHRDGQAIDDAREHATEQLAAAIPDDDPARWPTWRTLLPHIGALASHASSDTDTQTTATLFNQTGGFVLGQGQTTQAAKYFQRAFTGTAGILSSDHPDALTIRNNLAVAYLIAGDLDQAIAMLEQNITDQRRVLGSDHPEPLTSCNNLARAYLDAGRLDRAIPLFEQTLADRQRVLGSDHLDTLTSRNNLARAFHDAGHLDRAIPLFEQSLADLRRVLGSDHPNTLTARSNLAAAYRAAGNLSQAFPLFEQALADQQRVLGSDHPTTLDCRNVLALACLDVEDLDRAIPMLEQTLADRQRVLGSDHPNTLSSRNNLASAYQKAGDVDQAIRLFKQNAAELDRVLGSDHPQVLTSRGNLAGAYMAAGDLDLAIRLFKQALAERQRVLGSDHPDTLISRDNLGAAYHRAGRLGRAIRLFKENLTERQRVLGSDHPTTLESRNHLACAYLDSEHLDRAIPLFEQNLADLSRVLGNDHPYALAARNNLARAHLDAGDLDRAIPMFRQNLAAKRRALGNDHPETLTFRNNLAAAYLAAGDLDQAIPMLEQTLADLARVEGSDHPETLTCRNNLATARRMRLQGGR